jgi:hypothetical protein
MKPLKVEISNPVLLTKKEILKSPGIYRMISSPNLRFVVSSSHDCYIFGDEDPFYKSGNYDIDNPTPRYERVNEKLVFAPR